MEMRGSIVGDQYNISFVGRFTFADHSKFQKIISIVSCESKIREVLIDLSLLEFIDSAALGMILIIAENLKKRDGGLILQNPTGQVARILEISQFSKLIKIEK